MQQLTRAIGFDPLSAVVLGSAPLAQGHPPDRQ